MSINGTSRSGGALTAAQTKSRIDRLMASKLNDDEEFGATMDYLENIDTLASTSNVTERKLRLALQNRELELNRQFLANFEEVCSSCLVIIAILDMITGEQGRSNVCRKSAKHECNMWRANRAHKDEQRAHTRAAQQNINFNQRKVSQAANCSM